MFSGDVEKDQWHEMCETQSFCSFELATSKVVSKVVRVVFLFFLLSKLFKFLVNLVVKAVLKLVSFVLFGMYS